MAVRRCCVVWFTAPALQSTKKRGACMAWMVKLRGGLARVRDGVGAGAPMRILSCEEAVRFEHRPLDDGNLIIEAVEDFEITITPPPVESVDVPQPDSPKPKVKRRRRKKAD